MENEEQKYLGYLKYYGEKVEEGFLDTRKTANALIGFDEVLRYFIYRESNSLKKIEFEIPVKIEKGSWLALIPDTFLEWLMAGGGIALTTYATTAAKKMAENDFKDIGFKMIFSKVFTSICGVINLARHLKTTSKKDFQNLKFRKNNTEVGVPNEDGEILYTTPDILEKYKECPEFLFSKITEIIEEERELEIGLINSEDVKTSISETDKSIFYNQEDEDDIVLPELIHGQYVELKGHTTRGNEKTNTIGFLYSDHVLTCKPQKGSIVNHKVNLFDNCLIRGVVDRLDKHGNYKEKKPSIIYTELLKIDDFEQKNLF